MVAAAIAEYQRYVEARYGSRVSEAFRKALQTCHAAAGSDASACTRVLAAVLRDFDRQAVVRERVLELLELNGGNEPSR